MSYLGQDMERADNSSIDNTAVNSIDVTSSVSSKIFMHWNNLIRAMNFELYIVPTCQILSSDSDLEAESVFDAFISNNYRVAHLYGESGSGKTMLLHHYFRTQWDIFQKNNSARIPIYLPLIEVVDVKSNFVNKYLTDVVNLIDDELYWLKKHPVLLILDGYDEQPKLLSQKLDLWEINDLSSWTDVKVIASCRKEVLVTKELRERFSSSISSSNYMSIELNCFDKNQIQHYIKSYINYKKLIDTDSESDGEEWGCWETYWQCFAEIPALFRLSESAYALSIIIEQLPALMKQYKEKDKIERLYLMRIDIYDQFVSSWFERRAMKVLAQNNCIVKGKHKTKKGLVGAFRRFSEQLAAKMLQRNERMAVCAGSGARGLYHHQDPWWQFFWDDSEPDLTIIRSACPIREAGNNCFVFIHDTLREYFGAKQLFSSSVYKYEVSSNFDLNCALIKDAGTLEFLAEQIQKNPHELELLYRIIDESRSESRLTCAAANAITIMVRANINFSHKCLQGVKIAGASLIGGIFCSTDFSGADLRNVDLRGANITNANLTGAMLEGIVLGEGPSIRCDGHLTRDDSTFKYEYISTLKLSSDGRYLAVGTTYGQVNVYDTERNIRIRQIKSSSVRGWLNTLFHDLSRHYDEGLKVISISFSSDNTKIIISSHDSLIYVFDLINDKLLHVLHKPLSDTLPPFVDCLVNSSGEEHVVASLCPGHKEYKRGSYINKLVVWSLTSGKVVESRFLFDADGLWCVPGGKMLVYYNNEKNQMIFLDTNSYVEAFSVDLSRLESRFVDAVAFSRNNVMAVVVGNSLWLYDLKTESLLPISSNIEERFADFHISEIIFGDNAEEVYISDNRSIECWNIGRNNKRKVFSMMDYLTGVRALFAYDNSSRRLYYSYDGIAIKCLDQSAKIQFAESYNTVTCFFMVRESSVVLTGHNNGVIRAWDIQRRYVLYTGQEHLNPVFFITFIDCTEQFITVDCRGAVKVWDVSFQINDSVDFRMPIELVSISRNARFIVAATATCIWYFDMLGDRKLAMAVRDINVSHLKVDSSGCIYYITRDRGYGKFNIIPDDRYSYFMLSHPEITPTSLSTDIRESRFAPRRRSHFMFHEEKSLIAYCIDNQYLVIESLECPPKTLCKFTIPFNSDIEYDICFASRTDSVVIYAKNIRRLFLLEWSNLDVKEFTVDNVNHAESIYMQLYKDFFFILEEDEMVLYCFTLNEHTMCAEILWGSQRKLQCNDIRLSQATGLWVSKTSEHGKSYSATEAQNVFIENNALGAPSKDKPRDIYPQPYVPTSFSDDIVRHDMFSQQNIVDHSNWYVTLFRRNNKEHTSLFIEGVSDNRYISMKADLLFDQQRKKSLFGKCGYALIELLEVDYEQFYNKVRPYCCYAGPWNITSEQGLLLIRSIQLDRESDIMYLEMGSSALYSPFIGKSQLEQHSCVSWCEKHLLSLGIRRESSAWKWLDAFVAVPSLHVPDTNASNKKGNCKLM
ncbi:MAG: hypothetical protein CMF50_04240 [Legionellales bacterium]|nr:hypothetical protein [Legionellales bacterium]